ncbi:MAG: CRISPR-associated protein Cas5 [Desulfitobacterium hafniense]|nr:CRISPR-associated protein Cas5 [Desulfitobacterium hafniense]
MAEVVQALKVTITAPTASFRYPHIMIGRLPTYESPPPATIYGLLCSALGKWFEVNGLSFAYTFTYDGLAEDLETGQMLEVKKNKKDRNLNDLPRNVEGSLNPQKRQFLFNTKCTLYLKGSIELLELLKVKLLSPTYALLMGRSQDLACCHSADYVELAFSNKAFISNTILPWDLRQWVIPGEPVLMPESIDYSNLRQAQFGRYLQLKNKPLRIFGNGNEEDIISVEPFNYIVVDQSEVIESFNSNLPRGIWFHDLKGLG